MYLARRSNTKGERWVAQTRPEGVVPGNRVHGLWGQATKCMWWMPWRLQAMKDVIACDKLRGAGKLALIRRFPNGETHRKVSHTEYIGMRGEPGELKHLSSSRKRHQPRFRK